MIGGRLADLLGRLFGWSPGQHPGPPRNPFRGWEYRSGEAWWGIPGSFLGALGASFDSPRVVEKRNDSEIELRGETCGFPFRIVMSVPGYDTEVEMRVSGEPAHPGFDLEYDPQSSESRETRDMDPVWDEEDEEDRRVFLARHIFVEGAAAAGEALGFLSLPGGLRERTLRTMESRGVMYLRVRDEEIWASFLEEPRDMDDPGGSLLEVVGVIAEIAGALKTVPPVAEAGGAPSAPVRCRYCGAWFYLSDDARCMNCAAPFDGPEAPGARPTD